MASHRAFNRETVRPGAFVQKSCSLFLVVLLLSHVLSGQTGNTQAPAAPPEQQAAQPAPQPSADTSNFTSAKGFVLEEATPVKLRFNRTVSSADAHAGDTVDFEVLQDISVNGTPVISKGGFAFGTVTEAQPKRRMARGGKLEINIDYVKLLSSEKAALRAVKGGKGGGHTGYMTAGIVGAGILFFPAAPFFLFMHGKDITLPKGTEFTAYINGDMKLDIAKFQPAAAPPQDLSAAAMIRAPAPRLPSCRSARVPRARTSRSMAALLAVRLPRFRWQRAITRLSLRNQDSRTGNES